MKKLRLEMDALVVESFDTAAAAKGAGTVEAHATPRQSCQDTCQNTCLISCEGSCFESCAPCGTQPTECATGVPFCCIA